MRSIGRIWERMKGLGQLRDGTKTGERICTSGPEGVICKPPNIWADDRIFFAWQRSHMANERTFLSWSRTSISLLAFGFVIQRFELFMYQIAQLGGHPVSLPSHQGMIYLSFFCFGMAGLSALAAGWRFLAVRRHLNWGMASYSFIPDVLVVSSVLAIIIVTLALTFSRLLGISGQ